MSNLKPNPSFEWLWLKPWALWLVTAWLLWSLYAWFSYSLTAPNLVLSTWAPFWQFQTWIWKTFYNNRPLLTQVYAGLISGLWLHYAWGAWLAWCHWQRAPRQIAALILVAVAAGLPLLLANNNLSYDVFNYLFNAKMVIQYQGDPHVKVALDFPDDPWLRFMHNTHTPAPYAYGWTAVSLLPYSLGLGKFLLAWWMFRFWSWLSLLGLAAVYWRWRERISGWAAWLVLANPLLISEIVANSHNDLWMMVPAVVSLGLVAPGESRAAKTSLAWSQVVLSAVLLAFSISMKWVTLVLVPIWLGLFIWRYLPSQLTKNGPWLAASWPLMATVALFIPLLTLRSQQFHPWYWSWCLVWLPWVLALVNQKALPAWLRLISRVVGCGVLAFAISSSYRYLPFLWHNDFAGPVLYNQKLITWVGGGAGMVVVLALSRLFKRAQ